MTVHLCHGYQSVAWGRLVSDHLDNGIWIEERRAQIVFRSLPIAINHLDRRLAKGNRGYVVGAVGAVGQQSTSRFQIRLPAPLLPCKSVNKDMEITPGKIG